MAWNRYRRRSTYCRYCYNYGHKLNKCPDALAHAADPNSSKHQYAVEALKVANTKHCSYCRRKGEESAGHTAASCTLKKNDTNSRYEIAMSRADAIADVAANHGISIGSTFFAPTGVFSMDYNFGFTNNIVCKIIGFTSEFIFDAGYPSAGLITVQNLPKGHIANMSGYSFSDSIRREVNRIRNDIYDRTEGNKTDIIRKVAELYFSTIAEVLVTPPIDYEQAYLTNIETMSNSIKAQLRIKSRKRKGS